MSNAKTELIEKIKEKKELSGLTNSLISDMLESYLEKYKINLENLKNSEAKIIVKDIRRSLRDIVGRFQKSIKKRTNLLEIGDIETLLKSHSSTSERLSFYPKLKKLIDKLNVKSILDLGCGLNPIALADKNLVYYAADVKEDDLELVKRFFEKNNFQGRVFVYNLRKISNDLPNADLCIIFKVLDVLEKKQHGLAEKILNSANCKYFLISFATKTLSSKPMKFPGRNWLESILKKFNYKYKIFSSDNEIFYLIKKSK